MNGSSITKSTELENKKQKYQELENAETEKQNANKKASGKQKLKDLGLDDDEIQALMGV